MKIESSHCGGFWGVVAAIGTVAAVGIVTAVTVYWTVQELYEQRRSRGGTGHE